jgi:hypothetical protein
MAKKKKRISHQDFPIPPQRYNSVGRSGHSISGVPWYALYYVIGFGGYGGYYGTGYGNDDSPNETAQNGFGQETGNGSDSSGNDSGDGGGGGAM